MLALRHRVSPVPWINNTNLLLEILEHYSHLGRGFSQPRMYEKHDKAQSLTVFKLVCDSVAGGA